MASRFVALLVALFAFLVPVVAFTQDVTPTPIPEGDLQGAVALLPDLFNAATTGNWQLVVSMVLMIAVFAFRTYGFKSIPKRAIPWATAAMAAASYVSGALYMGVEVLPAALKGLEVGIGAVGIWQLWKAVRPQKPSAEVPKE